jgi:aerobic-type carbon monoxide dehydrogenase small subunit (CoxS/CutS family)
MRIGLQVNGSGQELEVEPRCTLLEALREHLGLTGTKQACDMGDCGACTVQLDGRAVYACLTLALDCAGQAVATIEGLSPGGRTLHRLQQAFIAADAFQCGFCTPGQIMALKALFDRDPAPTDEDIVRTVSGNLCRCGAYRNIVRAARMLAGREAA